MQVISRSVAYLYKKELNTGKHNASGAELSEQDKQHRIDAIAKRACTLQPRYRQEEDKYVNKMKAEMEAQANRVIEANSATTVEQANRVIEANNTTAAHQADRILGAMKHPAITDDMSKKQKITILQNRRDADMKEIRDIRNNTAPQGPKCIFILKSGARKGQACGRHNCKAHAAALDPKQQTLQECVGGGATASTEGTASTAGAPTATGASTAGAPTAGAPTATTATPKKRGGGWPKGKSKSKSQPPAKKPRGEDTAGTEATEAPTAKDSTSTTEEIIPEELRNVFDAPEPTISEEVKTIFSAYDRCLSTDELLACRMEYMSKYTDAQWDFIDEKTNTVFEETMEEFDKITDKIIAEIVKVFTMWHVRAICGHSVEPEELGGAEQTILRMASLPDEELTEARTGVNNLKGPIGNEVYISPANYSPIYFEAFRQFADYSLRKYIMHELPQKYNKTYADVTFDMGTAKRYLLKQEGRRRVKCNGRYGYVSAEDDCNAVIEFDDGSREAKIITTVVDVLPESEWL